MKLKVKKTTFVEVDVNFPVYKSFLGCAYVKVISEDLSIRVDECGINTYTISETFLTTEDYKDSNSDEFDNAFESTMLTLKTLV